MKLIEACVRTEVADKVIRALDKLRVSCVSVIDVKTIGVETAEKEKELSVEYATAYATRSKIKIFCDDKMATKIFDTIINDIPSDGQFQCHQKTITCGRNFLF